MYVALCTAAKLPPPSLAPMSCMHSTIGHTRDCVMSRYMQRADDADHVHRPSHTNFCMSILLGAIDLATTGT
jgi:hypothetical protein